MTNPDLSQAFTGGVVRRSGGGAATIRILSAGLLRTGGTVAVHDPFDGPEAIDPLPVELPAGEHEVRVCLVTEGETEKPAAVALVSAGSPPARWERLPGRECRSGFVAVLDEEAAFWADEGGSAAERLERWSEKKKFTAKDGDARFVGTLAPRRGTPRLVAVRAGCERHSIYVGRDASGSVAMVAAGFGVLEHDGPFAAGQLLDGLVHAVNHWLYDDGPWRDLPPAGFHPDATVAVDGKVAPGSGPATAVAGLRAGGLGQLELGAREVTEARARASVRWLGSAADFAGELALEVQGGRLRRVAIRRPGEPRGSVPDAIGKDLETATELLRAAGYALGVTSTRPHRAPAGTVIATLPPPGTRWAAPSAVRMVTSAGGASLATVPDVMGLDEAAARQAVDAAGLYLGVSAERVKGSTATPGTVAAQTPAAGTEARAGTAVEVRLAAEEERVFLPSLDGLALADAEFRLKLVGLKKGKVTYRPGPGAEGTVISSSPAGGTEVPPKSKVDLVVSRP